MSFLFVHVTTRIIFSKLSLKTENTEDGLKHILLLSVIISQFIKLRYINLSMINFEEIHLKPGRKRCYHRQHNMSFYSKSCQICFQLKKSKNAIFRKNFLGIDHLMIVVIISTNSHEFNAMYNLDF